MSKHKGRIAWKSESDLVSIVNDSRRKGIEEGIEQGMLEEKRKTAITLLERKFKSVPSELKAEILGSQQEPLDRITEGIFEFETIAEVEQMFR